MNKPEEKAVEQKQQDNNELSEEELEQAAGGLILFGDPLEKIGIDG